MQIQQIINGKKSELEKLFTLGDVSSRTGIKTSDLRGLYKANDFVTYNIGNAVCITETDYKKLIGIYEYQDQKEVIEPRTDVETVSKPIKTKLDYKNDAKKKVRHKFKIGDLISLKIKSKAGSKEIIKGFRVVKFIYTINDTETNTLILKQIYGPKGTMYTLNRHDCKKLHIKYEPELQVFSMLLDWGIFKEKNSKTQIKH